MRLNIIPVLLASLLLLASCAETELATHVAKTAFPRQEQGNFKVGSPYDVEGKTYTPTETYTYTETGIASWYGPGFDGKRTANGERFDKNELTAAHRTLQMPSLVRVTNLENGRSLVVRVNDRGPFKRGRVMDVSERAAVLLGFRGVGTAKVRLDLLADESRQIAQMAREGKDTSGVEVALNEHGSFEPIAYSPQQQTSVSPLAPMAEADVPVHTKNGQLYPDPVVKQFAVTPSNIYVQAGSFSNQENARRLALSVKDVAPAQIFPAMVRGQQFYRVRLGPVPSVDKADALLERLASTGHKESIIVVE